MSIRAALADDQALVRSGFRSLLERAEDIEVVGEAENGAEAIALARSEHPDVLLMDIRMPELDGLEATRQISGDPDLESVRVLMLTTYELDEYLFESLHAGASGFLLKDIEADDLREAVRVVARGDSLLSPSVTTRLIEAYVAVPSAGRPAPKALDDLTAREREILGLVARGLSNDEIAEALVISPLTAKTHVSRTMLKLGARDRAQLVVAAYECGLVRPGGS